MPENRPTNGPAADASGRKATESHQHNLKTHPDQKTHFPEEHAPTAREKLQNDRVLFMQMSTHFLTESDDNISDQCEGYGMVDGDTRLRNLRFRFRDLQTKQIGHEENG